MANDLDKGQALARMRQLMDQEGAQLTDLFVGHIDSVTCKLFHTLLMERYDRAVKEGELIPILTYRVALYGMMHVLSSVADREVHKG